uniref:Vacuolar protein sorting-associated protein 51 homolog n=1 Tax=Heterorhabditis bacteriophora TaxID=37862 RepID=A0A1I7XF79_HETBA
MSTCQQVVNNLDCSTSTISLIVEVSRHEVDISRKRIQEEMKIVMHELRQSLLSTDADLQHLANKLEQSFVFHVKSEFARNVHEHLLIAVFQDLTLISEAYGTAESETRFVNPFMMLLLAFTLHRLANKSALYLLSLCREQFSLTSTEKSNKLTGISDVTILLKTGAQSLLRRFANHRGLQLGENLAKGCDGLRQPSISPTGYMEYRSAVRRAIEEVAECDRLLSHLFGGNQRKEGRPRRAPDAPRDSLWCERIDFHQQIHFNKASIVTAIVKIILKTFIECIRLQTYGKYAVEQIQVDCYCLQRGLSPLVADEVVVNSMVDQALLSALKRCLEPVLVHPNKLIQICEDRTE